MVQAAVNARWPSGVAEVSCALTSAGSGAGIGSVGDIAALVGALSAACVASVACDEFAAMNDVDWLDDALTKFSPGP